jgi:hypothetical protein
MDEKNKIKHLYILKKLADLRRQLLWRKEDKMLVLNKLL